jgi:hypothetical protein
MRIGPAVLASIACAPLLVAPATAAAQSDAAIAEQLFRDGRTLLEAGKTDEACDKFAASQRLAPAIGTQLNLALCRERQGRTATAWSLYVDVEVAAQRIGDGVRARYAHDHGAALASQLRKVVIEVPRPPPGMVVQLDGTQLPTGALGTEIPLDPGDHDLVVTAPGKKPWEQSHLSLGPSATTAHVRVELEDEPLAPSLPAAPPPVEATPGPLPGGAGSPEPQATPGTNTKRVAGLVAGGAGLVALGLAGYYGLTAISRKNDESNYPAGSQDQLTVYDQAKTAQTWAFVLGGVGVCALGVGAYFLVTSYAHPAAPPAVAGWRVVPALGAGLSGALLQRTF